MTAAKTSDSAALQMGDSTSTPVSRTSLLDQSPLRAILGLAIPTTGVMLVATVSSVLHTYFVSRLGADAIAAVSLVLPVTLVMLTFMGGGVGAGISSAMARALGAGNQRDANAIAEHALLLTAVLAVVFTVLIEVGAPSLFAWMGGSGEVLRQATIFARVLFGGLLISFVAATFDSLLRGEGNMRVPALYATLSLLLQIALTPLFMFHFGLGIAGAAVATLTGQLIGILPRAVHIFGGRGAIRPRLGPRTIAPRYFADILRVGVPASLGALINYVGLMILTGVVARYGNEHLAAYGLATRLDFILFSLGYGVASATLTLVGMATGASRPRLAQRYVRQSVILAMAVVALPALIVTIWPATWIGIFTADPGIHAVGAQYFHIIGPTYLFLIISMVLASSFQGIGRATVPLAVLCARVALVLICATMVSRGGGLAASAVFYVIAAGNVFSSLVLATAFRSITRIPLASHGGEHTLDPPPL